MINYTNTALTSYETYKQSNYELKTIRLNSPILHIGSQVNHLNPFEYLQTASKVYLPNQDALAQALYQQGGRFLQDYIDAIENRQPIDQLLEQAFGEDWQQKKTPEGLPIFPDVRPKWTQQPGQTITDLRPMIRNGSGQLYIPGSSIKGAIRTAIAYHLLKHAERYQVPKQTQLSEIEKQLRTKLDTEELGDRARNKFLDDDLFIDNLFSNYTLKYQNKTYQTRSAQNTDFLRAVKVSDSKPLIKRSLKTRSGKKKLFNSAVIAEAIISSHFPDWKAKSKGSIFAELVYNVQTEFTITLDSEMLSWFQHRQDMKIPFSSIKELLAICAEFSQDQWQLEANYWQNLGNNRHQDKNLDFDLVWKQFYSKTQCPYSLRIGWGTGMYGTTITGLLPEDMRSILRDTCGIPAPNFEAPKSRRTIVDSQGEIRLVPGWVKLKIL